MKKPVILVVESEDQYLNMLQSALKDQFEVLCAKTDDEAINQFNLHNGEIELAILDYDLPYLSATEFVKKMAEISYEDIPDIIITTLHNDPKTMIESMIQGLAFEIITKPYDKTKLTEVIKKLQKRKKEEFEQKNQFLEKNKYIQEKMNALKTKQFENLEQCFGEAVAREQMGSFSRYTQPSQRNIPLSVTLRILEDETGEIAPLPRVAKVLVIEDEEPMLEVLEMMLEEHYVVYLAKTGQEGLDKLNSIPDLDVVLLDIGLPDISGDQILCLMNEKKRADKNSSFLTGPDVVVLTAYSDEETIKNLCRNGATGYITKGAGKETVLDSLKKMVENRYYFKVIPQLLDILKHQNPSFKTRLMLLSQKVKKYSIYNELRMAEIYRYFPEYQNKMYPANLVIPKLTFETQLKEFLLLLKERALEEKSQNQKQLLPTIKLQDLQLKVDEDIDDKDLPVSNSEIKKADFKIFVYETDKSEHQTYRTLFGEFSDVSIFRDVKQMLEFIKKFYGKVAVVLIADKKVDSFQKIVEIGSSIQQIFEHDPQLNNRVSTYILSDKLSLDEQYLLINKSLIEMCFSKTSHQSELVKAVKNTLKTKMTLLKS